MNSLSVYPPSLHFSSDSLPPQDRIAVWREVLAQKCFRVEVEPLPDAPFRVDVKLRSLPGLKTVVGTLGGTCDRRTPSLIAQSNTDVGLLVVQDGTALASQLGREVTLREGDAVFFSGDDTGFLLQPGPWRRLGFAVPHAALKALVPNVGDAMMRPVPRHSEALRLLKNYAAALEENHDELARPVFRLSLVSHFHDLTRASSAT